MDGEENEMLKSKIIHPIQITLQQQIAMMIVKVEVVEVKTVERTRRMI